MLISQEPFTEVEPVCKTFWYNFKLSISILYYTQNIALTYYTINLSW